MKNLKTHARRFLEDISQSFFFQNAYFGLALLSALGLFNLDLFVHALFPALIGYAVSIRTSTPKALKDSGLLTINCFFLGLAMTSLYEKSATFYFCLLLGSLSIPFLTKSAHEILQHWKLSPFIFPYIVAVWTIRLCDHEAKLRVKPISAFHDTIFRLPRLSPYWVTAVRAFESSCLGVGRILFLPNSFFGLAILALVALFSPRRGIFFLLGMAVATVTAYLMAPASSFFEFSAFTYSAGLVGLGLASFPEKFRWTMILLFCATSTLLTIATKQLLLSQQLPALSFPYVLTLWFALLSRSPRLNLSWASSIVAAVFFFSSAHAQARQDGLSVTTDLTWASEYVMDGFRIGDASPVFEPSVALGLFSTGISAMIWSSIRQDRSQQKFDEFDLLALYSHTFFKEKRFAFNLHGYLDYWDFPKYNVLPFGESAPNVASEFRGNKAHAGISAPNLLPLAGSYLIPTYNVYYWIYWAQNQWNQYEGGAHHELALQYFHSIPKWMPGVEAQYVGVAGSMNYNDGAFGVHPGWSHSIAELLVSVYAMGSTFTFTLNRQWSFAASVDPQDELWSTLSFTKHF